MKYRKFKVWLADGTDEVVSATGTESIKKTSKGLSIKFTGHKKIYGAVAMIEILEEKTAVNPTPVNDDGD